MINLFYKQNPFILFIPKVETLGKKQLSTNSMHSSMFFSFIISLNSYTTIKGRVGNNSIYVL